MARVETCSTPVSNPSALAPSGGPLTLTRMVRRRYVLALALVAGLTLISQALVQYALVAARHDSHVVNISGRQRMLSQRLTQLILRLAASPAPADAPALRIELTQAVEQFVAAHQALRDGDDARGIPHLIVPAITEGYHRLDRDHQELVAAAHAALQATTPAEHAAAAARALAHEQDFLVQMDQIVKLYEELAARKVRSLQGLEIALTVLVLLALAGEALLIFEPMTRDLRHRLLEVRAAHRKLKQQTQQVEAALAAKRQFLANMSHELRTPLGAILGYGDTINPQRDDPAQISSALADIRRSGQHLLELVNDVLLMSEFDARTARINLEEVNLPQLLCSVMDATADPARAKGLRLTMRLAEAGIPPTLTSDPLRLRQALVKLLDNAVKFTAGGEVTLWAGVAPSSQLLRLEVRDTGMGMTAAQQEQLWEPFAQADDSMRRHFPGLGLGLPITRQIILSLGGQITVRSTPRQGTTFIVELPLTSAQCAAPRVTQMEAQTPALPVPAAAPTRVLVVDDDAMNRKLLVHLLQRLKYEAEAVDGAAVAYQRVQSNDPPELILLDMQMPEIDGYTAARQLRKLGYHQPVLALTADAIPETRQRCLDAGCDGYYTKPITLGQLGQALQAHLTTAGHAA